MAPRMRLSVPRYGLALELELLPDLAPTTSAALLAALPAAGLATCENGYGSVVCLRLPSLPGPLPRECATNFPIPGDVFLFERGPEGPPGVELVVFYERTGPVPAGTPFDGRGDKLGNRVGYVASDLSANVLAACQNIWQRGAAWAVAAPDTSGLPEAADDETAARAEIEARLAAWRKRTWRDHVGPPSTGGPAVALTIPEYNARTEVELFPDLAPHTCEQILAHLPVETTLMHGRYSGPEMFTQVGGKQWHWQPRPENQTIFPIPGDLIIYIDPPPRIQINYFHDRDAIPFGTPRPEPGNRVGRSVGNFHSFAEACLRVGYEGWKTVVVQRVGSSA